MKIPKRQYTVEFKELAVKRVKDGMTAGAAGTLNGAGATMVTLEQMELSQLRAENVH